MHYNLPLLTELCAALGLRHSASETVLDVHVEEGSVFRFKNYMTQARPECACGFVEAESHDHNEPILFTTDNASVSLTSADILRGLVDGTVLLRDYWSAGQLQSRTLIHKLLREDYAYLEQGDEVRIRRAVLPPQRQTTTGSSA